MGLFLRFHRFTNPSRSMPATASKQLGAMGNPSRCDIGSMENVPRWLHKSRCDKDCVPPAQGRAYRVAPQGVDALTERARGSVPQSLASRLASGLVFASTWSGSGPPKVISPKPQESCSTRSRSGGNSPLFDLSILKYPSFIRTIWLRLVISRMRDAAAVG
jgi:hypothetical protein